MNIFFSDIDNTLIYSHHRKIEESKIVVEHLEGREQAFMTEFSYDFFMAADWLNIIPVTTRTEQQYSRIDCFSKFRVKYAIVCNGGKLLVNGKEDSTWSHETQSLAQDCYDSLDDASEFLSVLCRDSIIHRPDKYMTYVKCCETEKVYRELMDYVDHDKVNVQRDGRKVYLFSKSVTKGNALERFMKRIKRDVIVAAGDSPMDVSMLNKADYAFASPLIFEQVSCANKKMVQDDIFSDGICKSLLKMREEGII